MQSLFNISDLDEPNSIALVPEEPFSDETVDLEDFVYSNPGLLGEGFEAVARQVSSTAGRIDILAVDKSFEQAQVAIVELKNVPADVDVLLQILRYASWVESNQDTVRLLFQEKGISPSDLDVHPILVVVAPVIQDALLELSQYVSSFEFDFIELRRFDAGGEKFVIVTRRFPSGPAPVGASPREEWGWERYRIDMGWNDKRIVLGKWLFNEVQRKIESKGWSLTPRFRKGYVPFQLGGTKNVFGIGPRWANGFAVWFKKVPKSAEEFIPNGVQNIWDPGFKTLHVNLPDSEFDIDSLDALFEAAYEAATT
jgi:hypothetical protein